MDYSRRSILLFAIVAVGYLALLSGVAGLDRPTWGDEWHFIETVKQFGHDPSLETLFTYDEMSTPLPFVLYAAWGRLFGFEIHRLRLLSLLIAFIVAILMYLLLAETAGSSFRVWPGVLFVLVHPYMIGFSLFVFTDMSAIMFMLAATLAMKKEKMLLFAVMLSAAMLCRQYLGFVFIAALIYFVLKWFRFRDRESLKWLTATLASCLPLLLLFTFWGGFHPNNLRRDFYTKGLFIFHPSALTLYISQLSLYMMPVMIMCFRKVWCSRSCWIAAVPLSLWYFVFPPGPSEAAVESGTTTVGLLHRFMLSLIDASWFPQVLFYIGFLFGLTMLVFLIRDSIERMRKRQFELPLFLNLMVLLFLLIMPFSYLAWEKYFMPVVPILTVRFLIAR